MKAVYPLLVLAALAWPLPSAAQDEGALTTQTPQARPRAVTPEPARKAQTPRPTAAETIDTDRTAPEAFSVVLVLGDMQASSAADNVPAAARKALTDMKDFLPYKGYRLLDTQWTLCCGSAPLSGRLKGPDDQEYELLLQTANIRNGEISVRFLLRETALSAGTAEAAAKYEAQLAVELDAKARALEVQLSQLQRQQAELVRRIREASPAERAPAEKELQDLRQEMSRAQNGMRPSQSALSRNRTARSTAVIDASFRMDVGETVVVGTSRTKGDKALIALLTAVPPKGTSVR